MSGILETRSKRLLDERAATSEVHDQLLSHVEQRPEGEKSLTEIEQKQIDGYRERAKEIDAELEQLEEQLERESNSAAASKRVRTHLAGRQDGVNVTDDGGITYDTFAQYARDEILGRTAGPIAEQIRGRVGGDDARNAARERLNRLSRTPANTLSGDVGGLIPDQHIAQIFQVIETKRPLVASATRATLDRGRLSYPKITQRPVVGVQATEKTEAGNQTMLVGMEETTATTYLGGGDLSWQAIEWSTPNALDLWFRLAAADYALKTEQDAGEVLQSAGFAYDIGSPLGATPTFVQFMTAFAAGLGEVYANSGRIGDTLYMSPDRLFYLIGLTTDTPGVFINGSLNVPGMGGSMASLGVVVSRGLDSGVMLVGDSEALLVAETAGAPVQLRAVEPAIGGLEVGIIGAFEAVVVDDGAFSLITTAS